MLFVVNQKLQENEIVILFKNMMKRKINWQNDIHDKKQNMLVRIVKITFKKMQKLYFVPVDLHYGKQCIKLH